MSGFENRFAEVQRKSREARAKLDANQHAKAAAEERKAAAVREQREQPDSAYSEWDSTPRAVAARQLESKPAADHEAGSETTDEAAPEKE